VSNRPPSRASRLFASFFSPLFPPFFSLVAPRGPGSGARADQIGIAEGRRRPSCPSYLFDSRPRRAVAGQ